LIERYDRVDDALHATRAALDEGVLPGGGMALYQSVLEHEETIKLTSAQNNFDKSLLIGHDILIQACKEPFNQILRNAGLSHHKIINEINAIPSNNKYTLGYDVRNKKFGDMFELGVIDPAKVARCALENAVSAATMLLMADCSLIDVQTGQNDLT